MRSGGYRVLGFKNVHHNWIQYYIIMTTMHVAITNSEHNIIIINNNSNNIAIVLAFVFFMRLYNEMVSHASSCI